MLRECCRVKRIPLTLPLSHQTITRFILWLAFERKTSSGTISVYLAGIRQLHIQHNVPFTDTSSEFTKMLLSGKKNSEHCAAPSAESDKRRPITPEILRKIKSGLTNSELTLCDKRMVWSACTMLFFSACRASEILSNETGKFNPASRFARKILKSAQIRRTIRPFSSMSRSQKK